MLGTKIEDGFWRKRLLRVCLEEDLKPSKWNMLLYACLLRKEISFTNKTLSFHFAMATLGKNMRLHMCLQLSIPNFGLVARYPHQPNIGGKKFSRY
jgi:hypothetical protein